MNANEPIFKSVFGDHWSDLPTVMKNHYLPRPHSHDAVTVKGQMDITATGIYKWFAPIFKILHILAPAEKNIPVMINLHSDSNSNGLHFDRTFYLANKKPYLFNSCMIPIKDNTVVEFIFMGIGWRTKFFYADNKVTLRHDGYVTRLFGKLIPLPITWLMGSVNLEKTALSEDEFSLHMRMSHFLGEYTYQGMFRIVGTYQLA